MVPPVVPRLGRDARRRITLVAGLQIAVAATEGIGLVLLVPVLALFGAGGTVPDWLARFAGRVDLATMLAVFVALVAVRGALVLLRNHCTLRLELAVVDGLRAAAWRVLLRAEWRTLSSLRRSDQASLLISNLDRVGLGVNQLLAACTALVTLLALGLAGLAIAPKFIAAAGFGGLAVAVMQRGLHRRATRLGARQSAAWNRIHAALGEALAMLRQIKGQRREKQAEAGVMAQFEELAQARIAFSLSAGMGQLVLQAVGAGGLALLVWLAMSRWGLTAVTILPMVALFARALPLLETIQTAWQQWLYARPALEATRAMILELQAVQEPDEYAAMPLPLAQGMALDGVRVQFAGQGAAALDDVTLTIPARKITALTGPSGAGKSTIADLLAGLIAPDAGTVSIDRRVLDAGLRRNWRRSVAYVEQDPILLAASLRDNLVWGIDDGSTAITDERLWEALSDVTLAAFVRSLPDGLDTRLGDGGRIVSGGERQRLMLARALLRRPQLLILDEATSALDQKNEAAIAAILERLRGRMTIVLIAHRGALLGLADQVIALDRGIMVDES